MLFLKLLTMAKMKERWYLLNHNTTQRGLTLLPVFLLPREDGSGRSSWTHKRWSGRGWDNNETVNNWRHHNMTPQSIPHTTAQQSKLTRIPVIRGWPDIGVEVVATDELPVSISSSENLDCVKLKKSMYKSERQRPSKHTCSWSLLSCQYFLASAFFLCSLSSFSSA